MKIVDKEALQFDDVLLEPQFSDIKSRKDVSTLTSLNGLNLKLPIISAPMDSITTPELAAVLQQNGALGALHRFQSIEDNLKQYKAATRDTIVSVGLDDWERIEALMEAGAQNFLLDVAHGAQESVTSFVNKFRTMYGTQPWLMVGNFATGQQILDFKFRLNNPNTVDAYRVGIGGGR